MICHQASHNLVCLENDSLKMGLQLEPRRQNSVCSKCNVPCFVYMIRGFSNHVFVSIEHKKEVHVIWLIQTNVPMFHSVVTNFLIQTAIIFVETKIRLIPRHYGSSYLSNIEYELACILGV